MPSFNMFVYGSLESFIGILNAVAMVFNQSSFMNGVYLLGGLIMLLLVLVQAAGYMAQPAQIIRNVVIYASLISLGSIPTSLTVEDIYTGRMNTVDNVPLMFAVPASVSSSALFGILQRTTTAYQGADSTYTSITTGGFMDPLKELLGMRTGLLGTNRALADTLREFTLNCWMNTQAGSNVDDLMKSKSGLQHLLTNGSVPAWTVNFIGATNKSEGDPVVCGDAANKIWAEAQAYIYRDVGTSPALVDQVKKQMASIGPRAGGSVPNLSADNLVRTAQTTLQKLGTTGQLAQDQMLTLLTASLLDETFGCVQRSGGSAAELTNCTSAGVTMSQAAEQWKSDAAGNASFFQGIMLPASMFLQMLAIALFPIIFIVAVLSIGKAVQLIASWLVLFIWSSSWLPVAASIQWVMQMILNNDIAKFKDGLTYGNVFQFYNVLSTNLAVGADLLAATPLIALAVLMGSPFAFANLASRWSSDRVNEKMVSPDLQTPGAVSAVGSRQTVEPGIGSSYASGESLAKLDVNSAISNGIASSRQNTLRSAESWSQTHEFGSEEAKGLASAIRQSSAAGESFTRNLEKSAGLSESDSAALKGSLGVTLSTPNPGGLSPVQAKALIEASGMSEVGRQKALRAVEGMSEDFKRVNEASTSLDKSVKDFSRMSQSHGYQDGIELAKSFQETTSLARGLGVSQSVTSAQFGKFYQDASDAGRMQYDQLRGLAAKEFMPGGALQGRNKSYSGMNMGSDFGQIEALLKSSDSRHVALGGAMVGALAGTNVSSNYGQYSSIDTPASGVARGGYNTGPTNTIPAANMDDPTDKVSKMVDGVPHQISEGSATIKETGLGKMAGDHLKNNLMDNLPNPKDLINKSRGGGQ